MTIIYTFSFIATAGTTYFFQYPFISGSKVSMVSVSPTSTSKPIYVGCYTQSNNQDHVVWLFSNTAVYHNARLQKSAQWQGNLVIPNELTNLIIVYSNNTPNTIPLQGSILYE